MSRNAARRKGKAKVSKTEQDLKYYLEDVHIELDRRCDRIRQEAEDSVLALKNCLSVQLAKLPTAVRKQKVLPLWHDCYQSMSRLIAAASAPVARYPLAAASGASLVSAAKARIGGKRSAIQTISHVSKKSRIGNGAAAAGRAAPKTPGASKSSRSGVVAGAMRSARPGGAYSRLPTTPGTAMRRARRGEIMLSANGSPLTVAGPRARAAVGLGLAASSSSSGSSAGAGATSHKSSSSSSSASSAAGESATATGVDEEEGIAIDVALGDGMAVDVSDPSALAGLQGEDKERAVQQLLELQAKLASIVGSLQGPGESSGRSGAASGAAKAGRPPLGTD